MSSKAEDIGARIKLARGEESQNALARRAGVVQANLSRIEAGLCAPSAETAVKLAAALGRSLDWILMGWEPEGASPEAPSGRGRGT